MKCGSTRFVDRVAYASLPEKKKPLGDPEQALAVAAEGIHPDLEAVMSEITLSPLPLQEIFRER